MVDYPMMEVNNISTYVDHVYVYTKEKLGEDWNSAVQYLISPEHLVDKKVCFYNHHGSCPF